MPIETNDLVPFLEWLLGPGWQEGGLFRAWVFWPLALVAAVALAALLVWLRRGSQRCRGSPGGWRRWGCWRRRFAPACWRGPAGGLGGGEPAQPLSPLGILFARLLMGAAALLGAEWYRGSLYLWLALVAGLMLACLVMGSLAALLRGGLGYAVRTVDDALASLVADLTQLSSRRTWALSGLAVKEAIRRSIVVVFVVFLVLLLFAGWFIDPSNPDPAKLYMDLVLTLTGYLALFWRYSSARGACRRTSRTAPFIRW